MKNYIISKKNGCSYCQLLKNWLVARQIDIEIKYAEDNMDFCRANGIKTVPTLVIEREEIGEEKRFVSGFDNITAYLEV